MDMEHEPELAESREPEEQEQKAPEEDQAEAASQHGREKKAPVSLGIEVYQNVRTLAGMLAVLILIFTFVVRISIVSGPSMQNTLQGDDAMLVWTLGYTPKQGDVVVLTKSSYQEDSIVKRVIATEGQTVDIDYETGTVYVDGTALSESYTKERMQEPSYGVEPLNHVTVPEGCIFVMGDNRNHSADSRYPGIGIIDTRCVIGRVVMVIFPFSHLKFL